MAEIQTFTFPINTWEHLYSLQQAISHHTQFTGRRLTIQSEIVNHVFLNKETTPVLINFIQVDQTPEYPLASSAAHKIAEITFSDKTLTTNINVDRSVFEELRKNIMEYSDIDGIHIMISLVILCDNKLWNADESLSVIELNYAMKGD